MKLLNLLLICFFLCRTFLLQAQEREEPSELHHLAFDTPVNNGHWKIYSSDYHVQQDTVIKTAGKSSWKISSLSEELPREETKFLKRQLSILGEIQSKNRIP